MIAFFNILEDLNTYIEVYLFIYLHILIFTYVNQIFWYRTVFISEAGVY